MPPLYGSSPVPYQWIQTKDGRVAPLTLILCEYRWVLWDLNHGSILLRRTLHSRSTYVCVLFGARNGLTMIQCPSQNWGQA